MVLAELLLFSFAFHLAPIPYTSPEIPATKLAIPSIFAERFCKSPLRGKSDGIDKDAAAPAAALSIDSAPPIDEITLPSALGSYVLIYLLLL